MIKNIFIGTIYGIIGMCFTIYNTDFRKYYYKDLQNVYFIGCMDGKEKIQIPFCKTNAKTYINIMKLALGEPEK